LWDFDSSCLSDSMGWYESHLERRFFFCGCWRPSRMDSGSGWFQASGSSWIRGNSCWSNSSVFIQGGRRTACFSNG
jgi:hypothetical protein